MNTKTRSFLITSTCFTVVAAFLIASAISEAQEKTATADGSAPKRPGVSFRMLGEAAYTPIVVVKAASSPTPSARKAVGAAAANRTEPVNSDIRYEFSLSDWSIVPNTVSAVSVTAHCYEITRITDSGDSVSFDFSEEPLVPVFVSEADATFKTFYINRDATTAFDIKVPTTHGTNSDAMTNRHLFLVVSGQIGTGAQTKRFRGGTLLHTESMVPTVQAVEKPAAPGDSSGKKP